MADAVIDAEAASRCLVQDVGLLSPDFVECGLEMRQRKMTERTGDEHAVDGERGKILDGAREAEFADVRELEDVAPDKPHDVHAPGKDAAVVDDDAAGGGAAEPSRNPQVAGEEREAVAEELFRRGRLEKEHVVVEEDEMLRKVRDAVEVQLDGVGMERRKVFGRNVVRMIDGAQLRVRLVEPVWLLPARHEENAVSPRRERLDGAEPVLQESAVAVAAIGVGLAAGKR